ILRSQNRNNLPFPFTDKTFNIELLKKNLDAISNNSKKVKDILKLEKYAKIERTFLMVNSYEQVGNDYILSLSDETGNIMATIHEKAIKMDNLIFHYGMILDLENLSVFFVNPNH